MSVRGESLVHALRVRLLHAQASRPARAQRQLTVHLAQRARRADAAEAARQDRAFVKVEARAHLAAQQAREQRREAQAANAVQHRQLVHLALDGLVLAADLAALAAKDVKAGLHVLRAPAKPGLVRHG
eukprot:CAMPEP_0174849594 /NCGR_PEP_ID=MMETSP1114-20130205/16658_1 /TAXON_ID=312471 /ORGANISM="Neobodo designis, Strain CCAP 1951/1" /LENGTH=127 /DNA_ID=CAMNT_0016083969 /DNA_START=153 /DNA_END=536 /DNA_ORIENTATION=+